MAKRGSIKQQVVKDEIERPARSRKYTYHILIVCEDENTEKYYFQRYTDRFQNIWPNETVYLRAVGSGRNSLGVVRKAIEERSSVDVKGGPIPRSRLYELLEAEIKKYNSDFVYAHGKNNVIDEILKTDNVNKAIKRAEYLDNWHSQNNHKPIEANPNTLVYKLVSELESLLAYYSYNA